MGETTIRPTEVTKMVRSFAIFLCCVLLVAVPSVPVRTSTLQLAPAVEGDWPLFRGDPLQTGVARTTLPDRLEVRWKVDLKKGIESTAAIVKDTVYVGCYDEYLHAFDLRTGKPKWKAKLGPIKAPPSVYRDMVFVGDEDGMFHCVEAATGKKLWEFETDSEITGGANFDGDHVIFGSHDASLYCLSIKDMQRNWTVRGDLTARAVLGSAISLVALPAWRVKTEGPVNGSAVIANGQTFVAGCDSHLHIIDVLKGKTLAKIELSGQAAATVAVVGDKLYVGNMNSEMQGLDLTKRTVQWSYAPKRAQPFFSSAAVTDQYVVVGGRDRLVHALDRLKGETAWTFAADDRVDSSPVIVGKRVYFGSTSGTFYVVDLVKGKEVQSLTLGQRITASPAVAHGCVVIGTTDGLLYCLGKKD
jgi:outer membrane protein assembly factor BamB